MRSSTWRKWLLGLMLGLVLPGCPPQPPSVEPFAERLQLEGERPGQRWHIAFDRGLRVEGPNGEVGGLLFIAEQQVGPDSVTSRLAVRTAEVVPGRQTIDPGTPGSLAVALRLVGPWGRTDYRARAGYLEIDEAGPRGVAGELAVVLEPLEPLAEGDEFQLRGHFQGPFPTWVPGRDEE